MKKSWAVIAIVFALLVGMICGGSMVGSAGDYIFGDIDGDGKISAGDARLILRHVAKLETLKEPGSDTTPSGKVVYDSNGVKITYTSKTKDDVFDGDNINFLVENNRSESITVVMDEVSVNSYMIDPFFAANVAPGKKANESALILKSELTRNGISTIRTISFKVIIYNSDNYTTIAKSNAITLNF